MKPKSTGRPRSKRTIFMHTRVCPENKKWLDREAVNAGKSVTEFLDDLLTKIRDPLSK